MRKIPLKLFAALLAVCSMQAQTPEFRLSAGDAIEIKFFYNPELNDAMQIRPDGRVSLPLIGDVDLAGKTVAAARRDLEERYKPTLKNSAVNITVKSFANQKIYVGGEVNRPSSIPLVGEMSALEAILDAGGLKKTGRGSKVVLIRKDAAGLPQTQFLRVNDRGADRGAGAAAPGVLSAATTALRPFDVIIVPESQIARLDRWVDQYIRQVIPGNLNGGFSYLFNTDITSVGVR